MTNDELTAEFYALKATGIGKGKFTRRMAIMLADQANMRPMSLVWRVEKMGLVKPGSWLWFKENGGITQEHITEIRAEILADQLVEQIAI